MTTLTILARKSKLGVGPHAEDTVEALLRRHMYPHLREIYYTCEAITFDDHILDEIHAEIRIDKPGSNKDAIAAVNQSLFNRRFHALRRAGYEKKALGELRRRKAQRLSAGTNGENKQA